MKQFVRRTGPLAAYGLTIFGLSYLLVSYAVNASGQHKELQVLQSFFSLRDQRLPPNNVILAAIDDITYQDYQNDISPRDKFPRILTARTLQKINSAQPAVVIMDLKFPKEKDSPDADELLERELRENPVTIWSGDIPTTQGDLIGTDQFSTLAIPSDDRFTKAAKLNLNMWTSSSFGIKYELSLTKNPRATPYEKFVLLRPLKELTTLPVNVPSVSDFTNYYGPRNTIPRVSLSKILLMDDDTLSKTFKDKVVLFGYQSVTRGRGQEDKDEYAVSVSNDTMFGVEIHANIVGNLLDGSFIKRYPPEDESIFLLLVLLGMSGVGVFLKPEKTIPIMIGFAVIFTISAYQAFARYQFWIPGVAPIWMAAFIISSASALLHYKYMKKLSKVWDSAFSDMDLEDIQK